MAIHPYATPQPSDEYFVKLAGRLYKAVMLSGMPEAFRKKMCLYVAAYLEDVISGLGLWRSFIDEHIRLYGKPLPFYTLADDYLRDEVNEEDVRFIVWNTWQKAHCEHPYVNPCDERIAKQAAAFYEVLATAYEEAPENELLENYWSGYSDARDADRKLTWLFGHTYLTEPSMAPYIERVTATDRFIIPTGPLALFLHEWIERLAGDNAPAWKQVKGLFPDEPVVPDEVREKSAEMYRNFVAGTNGKRIVYLNGYGELRRFLVEVLKWTDDDNHTLPQMKPFRNFVLMTEPEKGILLAKDVCECIADPDNPMYAPDTAAKNAFRLLTEETLCPPDLLLHCLEHHLLPDAVFPDGESRTTVQENADFIARHALLYYYRGD